MIDLHTHILPGMDDGAKIPEISLQMLENLHNQGISEVVLTPHYYADRETPDAFLERRGASVKALKKALAEIRDLSFPRIFLGAEVAFFDGISHCKEINKLTIRGTNFLLLEMPFTKWSERIVREVIELKESFHLNVVLAHVNRYFGCFTKQMLAELTYHDIIFQLNNEALLKFGTRRKALSMIRNHSAIYLGSDSHNLTDRRPNFDTTLNVLIKHLGGDDLKRLETTGWVIAGKGEEIDY